MPTLSGSHPEADQLSAYSQGRLPPADVDAISLQLRDCAACRALLAQTGFGIDPDTPSAGGPCSTGPIVAPNATGDIPPELIAHPKFRIVRQLGQGGMGTVYLAEHLKMDRRRVALKVINRELLNQPELLARFFAEVNAASKQEHANIVRAYDSDEVEGLHFLVLEYIDGMSLAEYVRRKGPLPVRLACDLIRQAAEGLAHAHNQTPAIIHRDIKPGNLMVTRTGVVKVLDFGLARLGRKDLAGDGLTKTGAYMGTPEYVAPEQAFDASRADARSDVYSLGCTLYFLLTGKPPFEGADAVMQRIEREPTPLHECKPGIPKALSAVAERMLAKKAEDRYQSAADVARALVAFTRREASKPVRTPATPKKSAVLDVELVEDVPMQKIPPMPMARLVPIEDPCEEAVPYAERAAERGIGLGLLGTFGLLVGLQVYVTAVWLTLISFSKDRDLVLDFKLVIVQLFGLPLSLFVVAAGAGNLLRPISLWRRWLPLLPVGLVIAMVLVAPLFVLHLDLPPEVTFFGVLVAWIVWYVVVLILSGYWTRLKFYERMWQMTLLGGLVNLLGSLLAFLSTSKGSHTLGPADALGLSGIILMYALGLLAAWLVLRATAMRR
jgi:serine/threonine protein kinase